MLGGAVISATSTTQHCLTLSSSKAKYVALAHAAKMALSCVAVLEFVQPSLVGKTIDVFEDSQGGIALAENPLAEGRTKHIDVSYHFIRELVSRKVLRALFRRTEEQPADLLTKALGSIAFEKNRHFFMSLSA